MPVSGLKQSNDIFRRGPIYQNNNDEFWVESSDLDQWSEPDLRKDPFEYDDGEHLARPSTARIVEGNLSAILSYPSNTKWRFGEAATV